MRQNPGTSLRVAGPASLALCGAALAAPPAPVLHTNQDRQPPPPMLVGHTNQDHKPPPGGAPLIGPLPDPRPERDPPPPAIFDPTLRPSPALLPRLGDAAPGAGWSDRRGAVPPIRIAPVPGPGALPLLLLAGWTARRRRRS